MQGVSGAKNSVYMASNYAGERSGKAIESSLKNPILDSERSKAADDRTKHAGLDVSPIPKISQTMSQSPNLHD